MEDPNSTLAVSHVCAELHIPTIRIEAGLSSFDQDIPEEINRIVCHHTSDVLFTLMQTAMGNLEKEGLSDRAILTGDIMVDAHVPMKRG